MSWIINCIMTWFCKHEYKRVGRSDIFYENSNRPYKTVLVYTCSKCLYTKKVIYP